MTLVDPIISLLAKQDRIFDLSEGVVSAAQTCRERGHGVDVSKRVVGVGGLLAAFSKTLLNSHPTIVGERSTLDRVLGWTVRHII